MRDLGIVANVAACCMVTIMMLGQWYEGLTRVRKVELVPCSATIENMARKLNVTLMDMCEVVR